MTDNLMNANQSYTGLVQKYIGSAYDTVKLVADSMTVLQAIYDSLQAGDLSNLDVLLATLEATTAKLDDFNDIYQGSLAANPTVRPSGGALQVGDMYFNTGTGLMMIYDGTWDSLNKIPAASLVPFTPSGGMSSTNVQAAIAEAYAEALTGGDHVDQVTGAHAATAISFTSALSRFLATLNVKTALEKMSNDFDAHSHTAGNTSFIPVLGIDAGNVQAAIEAVKAAGNETFIGNIDMTAAYPGGTFTEGDYWYQTGSGTVHATWAAAMGEAPPASVIGNEKLTYDGADWWLTTGSGAPSAAVVTFPSTAEILANNVRDALIEIEQYLDDHRTDALDAHAATAIGFDNSVNGFVATDVQAAIEEAATSASAHESDPTGAHAATAISFDDSGVTITAATVQAALEALDALANATVDAGTY